MELIVLFTLGVLWLGKLDIFASALVVADSIRSDGSMVCVSIIIFEQISRAVSHDFTAISWVALSATPLTITSGSRQNLELVSSCIYGIP